MSTLANQIHESRNGGESPPDRDETVSRRIDELTHRLSEAEHRMTPQRMAIIEILLRADHPTADDIFAAVHRQFPMMSLATVYKTLHTLEELGEVREIAIRGERSHFDALPPLDHSHVICSVCGKIVDVHPPSLTVLPQQVASLSGFEVAPQGIELYGRCSDCR